MFADNHDLRYCFPIYLEIFWHDVTCFAWRIYFPMHDNILVYLRSLTSWWCIMFWAQGSGKELHVIQSEDDHPPQLGADPASGATDSRDSIINDSQRVVGSRQPSLSDTQYRASSSGRRHTPPSSGLVRHVWGAAEPSVTTGEFFHIVSQKLF